MLTTLRSTDTTSYLVLKYHILTSQRNMWRRGKKLKPEEMGEEKLKVRQVMKRCIATATKDILQAAVYKATTDDKLPPKEKHVLTIVQHSIDPKSSSRAGGELLRRLRDCREPLASSVAAKTLIVLHRVMLAGGSNCLRDAGVLAELALICANVSPADRHPQAESCCKAAGYLQQLCTSGIAVSLRGERAASAFHEWAAAPLPKLIGFLPALQPLVELALDCAARSQSAHEGLLALRLGLIEDAFALTKLETYLTSRRMAEPSTRYSVRLRSLLQLNPSARICASQAALLSLPARAPPRRQTSLRRLHRAAALCRPRSLSP